MKITSISAQQNNQNRVSIGVDGKYRFSLDIFQLSDLGVRIGQEYTEEGIAKLEEEGRFGRLYARALEYSLIRPRSVREMRDYLWRKTLSTKVKSKRTGEVIERPGVSQSIADRALKRLIEKGYLDDEKFANFWIENRFRLKGISRQRLKLELSQKGVDRELVEKLLAVSGRSEVDELQKVIAKKRRRYADDKKFMQYLVRQGFNYDEIKQALSNTDGLE